MLKLAEQKLLVLRKGIKVDHGDGQDSDKDKENTNEEDNGYQEEEDMKDDQMPPTNLCNQAEEADDTPPSKLSDAESAGDSMPLVGKSDQGGSCNTTKPIGTSTLDPTIATDSRDSGGSVVDVMPLTQQGDYSLPFVELDSTHTRAPIIEECQLKDDYARSEKEAAEQTLELMKKTAGFRNVSDTASLRDCGVGPRAIMNLDREMSDDNRGAVYKQCALRGGIDHGEDPSITCKPAGKSQKHLAQLGNDPIDDESKAVYSSKVGPAKEVSVTPADHKEDTNKESPNDVAKPSSAAVSDGKAQLKNNDKHLPLDEAPPQEPAKKKARTSFAIPSSQVTDLSTDVELQPPTMKEKKFDDVAGEAVATLLDRQEFVDVLDKNVGGDPERRKVYEELASRHLCSFCSCHINTRPNTYTPIPSDVKAC